jgi:hypothetical protein
VGAAFRSACPTPPPPGTATRASAVGAAAFPRAPASPTARGDIVPLAARERRPVNTNPTFLPRARSAECDFPTTQNSDVS